VQCAVDAHDVDFGAGASAGELVDDADADAVARATAAPHTTDRIDSVPARVALSHRRRLLARDAEPGCSTCVIALLRLLAYDVAATLAMLRNRRLVAIDALASGDCRSSLGADLRVAFNGRHYGLRRLKISGAAITPYTTIVIRTAAVSRVVI
jgi:hypothetical protein